MNDWETMMLKRELFDLLERFIKNDKKGIDVYDFTERFVFYVFSEEDIEELKELI